ncbi:recombination mediator RecR [Patescibacteria group bacterium]|nr:recombination mediator RecR [Patescibacteria group bacterium]MBU4480996.1 recombination mediator RecR [Patescibacteria group bacterium]
MHPPSIQKLIDLFSKFPTVGPRTAARFVFYLMGKSQEEIEELTKSILELKEKVKICPFCFNSFEGESKLCPICSNPSRDKTLLCIVEKEIDLEAIEKIKKYRGLYFILGGTVSTFKKGDIEKLRIKELVKRIKERAEVQEIIIAVNPTAEGKATALYLERALKPFNKKITRLGRGLPVGGELEYADEETLSSAIEGRK